VSQNKRGNYIKIIFIQLKLKKKRIKKTTNKLEFKKKKMFLNFKTKIIPKDQLNHQMHFYWV